ncbi:gluconokinase [Rhizobium laguerreae]|uniref:gluconokinase n=1 Tax=Rhizobium laguerreae TaxID=1076926 RepID=UPI001C8FF22F|nr:gluconokinase [Rhizobium laguerreae]MBY3536817.1 gluconokinase [Rhizobium laguerreae]
MIIASMQETPIVVMGVSGCGKSTVARILSDRMGRPFIEGDDLHPPANVAKMSAGIALTDEDRASWLAQTGEFLGAPHPTSVASCSALRSRYRQRLRDAAARPLIFLYLQVPRSEVVERMSSRPGHFMPISLVDSQFAALEEPCDEPDVVTITGPGTASELADRFLYHVFTMNRAAIDRQAGFAKAITTPTISSSLD